MHGFISKEYFQREFHLAVLDFITAKNDADRWNARKHMAKLEMLAMQEFGFNYADSLHDYEIEFLNKSLSKSERG